MDRAPPASGIHVTPLLRLDTSSAAVSIARRVLPQPPAPVSVTSRSPLRSRATISSSSFCPADENRRRPGEVRGRDRRSGGTSDRSPPRELVETLRSVEVLEPVLAEVERFHPAAGQGACLTHSGGPGRRGLQPSRGPHDERRARRSCRRAVSARRCGDPCGRGSRGPAATGARRAHAERRPQPRRRPTRSPNATEERIALGVDLVAVVGAERLPEEAAVRLEPLVVTVTRLVQQARGTLDVGEQKGDGALEGAATTI